MTGPTVSVPTLQHASVLQHTCRHNPPSLPRGSLAQPHAICSQSSWAGLSDAANMSGTGCVLQTCSNHCCIYTMLQKPSPTESCFSHRGSLWDYAARRCVQLHQQRGLHASSCASLPTWQQLCLWVCSLNSRADKGDPLVLGNHIVGGRATEYIYIRLAVHLQQQDRLE